MLFRIRSTASNEYRSVKNPIFDKDTDVFDGASQEATTETIVEDASESILTDLSLDSVLAISSVSTEVCSPTRDFQALSTHLATHLSTLQLYL